MQMFSTTIPRWEKRFLATVRRDWHCLRSRVSSSRARAELRMPPTTLKKKKHCGNVSEQNRTT